MGNFYVNITTKDANVTDLEKMISVDGLSAFIVSENDQQNYCVLYEQICDKQDTNHLAKLLKKISQELACTAFGVLNHDDDMLIYSLWHDGEELDHYNSCPDIFAEEPTEEGMQPQGGNATLLAQTFLANANKADTDKTACVNDILHSSDYVFAVERHGALVTALGLPECAVGYGYTYLSNGELPENINSNQMIKINVK